MKRITLFVVGLMQSFSNEWHRFVVWLKKSSGKIEFHESEIQKTKIQEPLVVEIGDVAINPKWNWITVKNPKGRRNFNGFHDFGDSAGIKEGAKLTAVAIEGYNVLVSYESPKGQGAGSEAGNGTLFFVPKQIFATMTADYESGQRLKANEKARILVLLRNTLNSESAPSPS